jgi:hypothetical protein
MNAGKYLYAKLTADAGVSALVRGRIFPVLLPEKTEFPCVAYSVSNRPLDSNMKDRGPYHDTATVTLSIWADIQFGQAAYSDVEAIDGAIRAALDFVSSTAGGVTVGTCKYVASEDVFNEERTLIGRQATYVLTIKN